MSEAIVNATFSQLLHGHACKGIKAERFLVEKEGSGKYRLALSKVQDLVGEMFPELVRAKGYYSVHSLLERAIATRYVIFR